MKKTFLVTIVCLAAGAFAATVSNVEIRPTGAGLGPVEVTYDLDEAAIVTFDVLTNGVSIGQGAANAGGDANRYTLAGTGKRIFWMPHRDWEGHALDGAQVQVTAWSLDVPPPYLVAEIHGGDVQYYASADLVPDGGVTNRKYKTSHLVMRKMPAKDVVWTMGSTADDACTAAREVMHRVKLSSDYYVGVYEFTAGQFMSATNLANPTATKSLANAGCYPLTHYTYANMRGALKCNSADPTPNSLMGVLRARTGLAFDLPNAAQWEFACRAGHGGSVLVGSKIEDSAWVYENWQEDPALTANSTHEVGLRRANDFGLYDMQGNILELTVDYITSTEAQTLATFGAVVGTDTDGQPIYGDPPVQTSSDGGNIARCGGCYYEQTALTYDRGTRFSPGRHAGGTNYGSASTDAGYRLICPAANGGRIQ